MEMKSAVPEMRISMANVPDQARLPLSCSTFLSLDFPGAIPLVRAAAKLAKNIAA